MFVILLVSKLFYIFIGCVTNSAFGNNITFAKMFLGGDADWYIKIAENGYSLVESIKAGDGQANWAFFPLFPVLIRWFKYIFFFLNYQQAGILLSSIFTYVTGLYLVKTVRCISGKIRIYSRSAFIYGTIHFLSSLCLFRNFVYDAHCNILLLSEKRER